MFGKTQPGAPAATTAMDAGADSCDRLLSDDELDTVSGGLNPQPLPPRWSMMVQAPSLVRLAAFSFG